MTNKKITQRERSARLRPKIANASADVIWNAVHDWFHHERADKQLCADRAGVSRGCVIGILSHKEAPCERSPRVPPAVKCIAAKNILRRRKLVNIIARVTVGEGNKIQVKFPSAVMIAHEIQRREGCEGKWDPSTIHRDLMALGFTNQLRPLTSKAKGAYVPSTRLSLCHYLLTVATWLIVTDEKWFDTNHHGCRRQYVPPGGRAYPRMHTQHCTTAHFWGAVGKGFRLLIQFPDDYRGLRANSTDFIREVLSKFVEHMKRHMKKIAKDPLFLGVDYILQQDGLPIHTSKESFRYLDGEHVKHLLKGQWPAWSPDLSVIENIWELMERLIDEMQLMDVGTEAEKKAELVRNVWKAWNSISQETIDKYVASGAKRFAECIALKGRWTGH